MIRITAVIICATTFAGVLNAPVAAQPNESAYTDLDLKKCRHTPGKEEEDYGFWRCQGYAGIAVRVSAGDQRTYVSFGPKASAQPAAGQTFSRFNSLDNTRIEWRLRKRAGAKPTPVAAIVRWHVKIDDDDKPARGRVLVVTRLGGAVCHVGYVDALANREANALARELADKQASGFDCTTGKRIILGEQGDSVAGLAEAIERDKERSPPR